RTHAPTQIQHIADSITRFGFCNPILIDADNQIIAGHGRFEAAKLLGLQAVPALRLSHLSPSEKRAYLIADNRLAELAGWDRDMLATELQALLDCEFDVELTGFDLGEVESMLNTGKQAGIETADGQGVANTSSGSAISQAGDDWLLGDHRLLCGASGDHCAYAAADAAIRHWEAFARQSAILAGTNKTFKEIEAERTKYRVRGAVECRIPKPKTKTRRKLRPTIMRSAMVVRPFIPGSKRGKGQPERPSKRSAQPQDRAPGHRLDESPGSRWRHATPHLLGCRQPYGAGSKGSQGRPALIKPVPQPVRQTGFAGSGRPRRQPTRQR